MTDYEKAVTIEELEIAAAQCAKGLYYKGSVSGYMIDSLCKNSVLRNEILTGSYKISKYMQFIITEPKRREIYATRFRDRVWQKSMCNNGLRDQFLKPLIYDNGACQTDKGVDFAIDRTISFLQKYYREHGDNNGRYDHLDIKGYFPNTPHSITKRTTDKYIKDENIKTHIYNIIDTFQDKRSKEEISNDPFGPRGTALGSEISQLLQLALPNHIDHAIKERFKIKYYIRFNDDMLLISDNTDQLVQVREFIENEYARLGLQVTIKQKNAKLEHGIKFLKRRTILTASGKVIVKADTKKFAKERRTLRRLKKKLDAGLITMDKIADHYQSVRSGIARCDEKMRVRNLDKFYADLFGAKPPEGKRRKKNAYCKSKRANRTARGRNRKNEKRKPETKGDH